MMQGSWTFGDVLAPDTHEVKLIKGSVAAQGQYLAIDFEEKLATTSIQKNGVIFRMDDKLLFNAYGIQSDGTPDSTVTLLTRSR